MTKIVKISVAVVMGSSVLAAGANQIKLYGVKSGKVEYEIKGSGEIMGSKMQTFGKKRVIFDGYGTKNLTEENKIDKQNIMGHKKVTKTHTMTYMKNSMLYSANFKNRRIVRMENPALAMGALMGGGQNIKQTGEAMMKKMGGKKIGTDKVLGYTCDVWSIIRSNKQCIYKGIPLRVETNVMGLKTTEVATKAEFDISLSKDDFKLPDFPIYDMEGNKLDKSNLDAMDKKSEVQAAKGAEEMKALGTAMATAAKSAGVKKGERPTKAQQKKIGNSVMDAMLPQMKKEILAKGKVLRFGRECLGSANTLKEANTCTDKANAMSGEHEDYFKEWSRASKKKMLDLMDQSLESMKCIEKAKTFQAFQMCMPQK